MQINYFKTGCKTSSSKSNFGLCDDPPPASNPAYIDENQRSGWIANVINSKKAQVDFFAIDNCVDIERPNGEMEKRCDGLLKIDANIIFVELKSREGGKWFAIGMKQLKETISRFKAENNMANFNKIEAHVCNNLRPQSHIGQAARMQEFKDDTGYILSGSNQIRITEK